MKKLLKMIFCRHEYWKIAETTFSSSHGAVDHELVIIDCMCKKCGKRKSIKFKKEGIDSII